jgi:hypothetical protein
MTHMVTGTVVKVSVGTATGNRIARILRHGDIVPEGVDDELLARLADRGLISELPSDEELLAQALAEREAEQEAAQAVFDARVSEEAERILADRAPEIAAAALVKARADLEAEKAADPDRTPPATEPPPPAADAKSPAATKATARGAGAKQQ